MNASIIGWYGTETMGDRAIFDGIISVLNNIDENLNVKLGSFFPFYSERTLYEEKEVFKLSAPSSRIKIFDVKDRSIREENIVSSDIVIMGGGPLMDLEELYIILDCFKLANKKKIPAVIMGCGIGPLKRKNYINVVREILRLSTAISFRDKVSGEFCNGDFDFKTFGDPAEISVINFMNNAEIKPSETRYAAVNFREYPAGEYGSQSCFSDDNLRELCAEMAVEFKNVKLVPMHTFAIGGDDRYYLSKIAYGGGGISVIHEPEDLHELYTCFRNAAACIGMRYHSVFMQTILNGNNFILDYTNPKTGKISSFIKFIEAEKFYSDRTIQLQNKFYGFNPSEIVSKLALMNKFSFKHDNMHEKYKDFITQCLR